MSTIDDGRLVVIGIGTLVVCGCVVALLVDLRDTMDAVESELVEMRRLAEGDAMRQLEDEIEEQHG